MSQNLSAGFQERPHTADWALDVWAPDRIALLRTAVQGMYALMGVATAAQPRSNYEIELAYADSESLLVSFLAELLYITGRDNVAFDRFAVQLTDSKLTAKVSALPIDSQAKEIKAVTYHNLSIRKTDRGLETTIVFDV